MVVKVATTYQYIQMVNGLFGLTNTERKVLATFIDIHQKSGLDTNMFSTDIKKAVAKFLGRDDFNTLNNYIKRMHAKGAIKKVADGYEVHKLLLPNKKGTNLQIRWKKTT